jgi:small-conductance mechanosensitive channel
VAVLRPFDLGDRVYLVSSTDVQTGGDVVAGSLFVEDIDLGKTKLRYAATGEILYMSNYLLSTMRIYNLSRSANASIRFEFDFSILILVDDRLEKMRAALRQYVADHPVRWESFNYLRIVSVSAGDERVYCMCSLRHRSTWQNGPRIKNHQSDLLQFMYDTAMTMGVGYEVSPARTVVYEGGFLQQGVVEPNRRVDLLRRANVHNPCIKGDKTL